VTEADINSVWTSCAVKVPVIVAPAKVTTPSPSNRAPLASAVVTLVEKLALDSNIEPEPSNKLTRVLKLALDSVIEPLPSNRLTLVEKLPLSVTKSETLVENEELDSVIEPEPSNKLTLVLKLALDSVIEPEPSNRLTLVEREPLADEYELLAAANEPLFVVIRVLIDDETEVKSELPISATITLPNEPVEAEEPLNVAKLPLPIRILASRTAVIIFVSATLYSSI
jgi:hypothetical protein